VYRNITDINSLDICVIECLMRSMACDFSYISEPDGNGINWCYLAVLDNYVVPSAAQLPPLMPSNPTSVYVNRGQPSSIT